MFDEFDTLALSRRAGEFRAEESRASSDANRKLYRDQYERCERLLQRSFDTPASMNVEGTTVSRSDVFDSTSACVVVQAKDMQIYVYVSKKDADIVAFTTDSTGSNLPASGGPWVGGDAPDVLDAGAGRGVMSVSIQQDGYFIAVKQTHY